MADKQIPKRILKLLERRCRLAQALMDVCAELDRYCEKIGIEIGDPRAVLLTDIRIYCEPGSAYSTTKNAIQKALNGEWEACNDT